MKRIGREELERGDGQAGRPALVAVEGKVYDVSASDLWADGNHMNAHSAGDDLTLALQAAPHGDEVFERVEPAGDMEEAPEPEEMREYPKPPGLLALILAQHPHPVSVHFPIALCISAALFTLLGTLFGVVSLHTAALYNLAFAALMALPAIAAGFLSWYYNYGGAMTSIFRKKIMLSVLLMVLIAVALIVRLAVLGGEGENGAWRWFYTVIVWSLAPTVMGLGYLGGKITFPR